MENIEKVKEALNKNNKLDIQVKSDLLYIIEQFYLRLPNISLEKLCHNLKELNIVPGSMYVYTDSMQYVPGANEIVINQRKLNSKSVDGENALMKSVISMATTEGISFGFGVNRDLEALNFGFLEVLANNLSGNRGESDYEDEQRLVNLIFTADDFDTLFDAFFKNDSELVIKLLLTKCNDKDKLKTFLDLANHNLHTKLANLKQNESKEEMDYNVTKEMMELMNMARGMFDVNIDYLINKPVGFAPLKSNGYVDYDEVHESVMSQELEWRRAR